MPGAPKLGAGLALRLLSSRAPYGRAGVRFEPSPSRVYGVVEIGVDDLLDGAIAELLADPYVDVSVGPPGGAFVPVADLATFEEIAADMAEALAELVTAPVVTVGAPRPETPETPVPGADALLAGTFDPALPVGALKPAKPKK
jgi:hypothetical protein